MEQQVEMNDRTSKRYEAKSWRAAAKKINLKSESGHWFDLRADPKHNGSSRHKKKTWKKYKSKVSESVTRSVCLQATQMTCSKWVKQLMSDPAGSQTLKDVALQCIKRLSSSHSEPRSPISYFGLSLTEWNNLTEWTGTRHQRQKPWKQSLITANKKFEKYQRGPGQ